MRDSRDIQREVHDRLHAKDGRGAVGHASGLCCHSYNVDAVVWETLALLGEWELIQLDGEDATRPSLGPVERE